MKARLVAAVLVIAVLVAAWWMLRGDDGSPEIAKPSATHAPTNLAPAPTPRASRGADKDDASGAAPAAATVTGRVYIPGDPDHPSSTSPDLRKFEVVVYARPDTPPGDFVMPVPDDVVATARAAESGLFEIPLPSAQDGQTFLVTARADGGGFTATWHGVPAAGGRVEIRADPATPVTTIEVRRSSDGTPVAGATVRVGSLTATQSAEFAGELFVPRRVGSTDASGRAEIDACAGDHVMVTAAGFATADTALRSKSNVVSLEPGDSVAGVIVRPDGSPIACAAIAPRVGRGLRWLTDDAGRFRVDGGSLRGVSAHCSAPGTYARSVLLSPGVQDARIVLSPADEVIRGVVLFADGRPAALANVWPTSTFPREFKPVHTDEAGRFALPRQRSSYSPSTELHESDAWGRHCISAGWVDRSAAGNISERFSGQVIVSPRADGSFDDVEIRLAPRPRSWVVAKIRSDDGSRRKNSVVSVPRAKEETPREDGAMRFSTFHQPGTTVRLTVSSADGSDVLIPPVTRSVQTTAEDNGEAVEIRLPSLKPLRVTVESADSTIRELAMDVFAREEERGIARLGFARACNPWFYERRAQPLATAEKSVTVLVDTESPGLALTVSCDGLATVTRLVTPDEIAAGECHVRMIAGSTVTGRLPRPYVGEAIYRNCGLVSRGPAREIIHPARSASDGAVVFEHVGPGTWDLEYITPEFVRTVPRTIDVPSSVVLGIIEAPTIARLRGEVRYADGRAAGGAHLLFRRTGDVDDEVSRLSGVHARSDGSFDVPAERGAAGTLIASKPGYGAVAVALTADDDVALPPLVLPPEGRVEVRVRAPRDVDPTCEVRFELTSPVRARVHAPLTADEVWTTRPEDQFDHVSVHRGLPPGRVIVIAEGRGWRLEAPVTIVAGETAVVTLGE